MSRLERIAIFSGLGIAIFVVDQATKRIATYELMGMPSHTFLGDTFRLQYAVNRGAFLALGESLPDGIRFALFTVAVGILLLALTGYTLFARSIDRPTVIAYSCFIAGGIANLVDRIRYDGKVIDFMNLGIGPVRTGVFNVADVAVMVGIGLLLLSGRNARLRNGGTSDP